MGGRVFLAWRRGVKGIGMAEECMQEDKRVYKQNPKDNKVEERLFREVGQERREGVIENGERYREID